MLRNDSVQPLLTPTAARNPVTAAQIDNRSFRTAANTASTMHSQLLHSLRLQLVLLESTFLLFFHLDAVPQSSAVRTVCTGWSTLLLLYTLQVAVEPVAAS